MSASEASSNGQIGRADRTLSARLSVKIRCELSGRPEKEAEEVADLARRLLWSPNGPVALYPHSRSSPGNLRVSCTGAVDDPLGPAPIVRRLEATTAGGRRLLDRWGEPRSILEDSLNRQPPDRFRAARLLGRQPIDALDDERLLMIHLAGRAMQPGPRPSPTRPVPPLIHQIRGELERQEAAGGSFEGMLPGEILDAPAHPP